MNAKLRRATFVALGAGLKTLFEEASPQTKQSLDDLLYVTRKVAQKVVVATDKLDPKKRPSSR